MRLTFWIFFFSSAPQKIKWATEKERKITGVTDVLYVNISFKVEPLDTILANLVLALI